MGMRIAERERELRLWQIPTQHNSFSHESRQEISVDYRVSIAGYFGLLSRGQLGQA